MLLGLLFTLWMTEVSAAPVEVPQSPWEKLGIYPIPIGHLKYNEIPIKVYQESSTSRTRESLGKVYYFTPMALLDHKSASSSFNKVTKRHEIHFTIQMWSDELRQAVYNHLSQIMKIETVAFHNVHVLPFDLVSLTNSESWDYRYTLPETFIVHNSEHRLRFRITCPSARECDSLAGEMISNPSQFQGLTIKYSHSMEPIRQREVDILPSHILSSTLFRRIRRLAPDCTSPVFLTAADKHQLLSEVTSKVLSSFGVSEVVTGDSREQIYGTLEVSMFEGQETLSEHIEAVWKPVYWAGNSYRLDLAANDINNILEESIPAAQKEIIHFFSGILKTPAEVQEATGNGSLSYQGNERLLGLLAESKELIQWNGQKFVAESKEVFRVNLAAVTLEWDPVAVSYWTAILWDSVNLNEAYSSDEVKQISVKLGQLETKVTTLIRSQITNIAHQVDSKLALLNSTILSLQGHFNAQVEGLREYMDAKFSSQDVQILELKNSTDCVNSSRLNKSTTQLKVVPAALLKQSDNQHNLSNSSTNLTEGGPKKPDLISRFTNEAERKERFFRAATNGDENVVRAMIEAGIDLEEQDPEYGDSGLHKAARNGRKSIVKMLVNAGANVNIKSRNGTTPLFLASQEGFKDVVVYLIKAGANPDEDTSSGLTALHAASVNGRKEVVDLLLKAGANPNEKTNVGRTALHLASEYNRKGVVDLLLKAGANPNEKTNVGRTALHLASEYNRKGVVDILIKACANPNEKDYNGWTSLHLATENGHKGVVDLLIKAGANPNEKNNNGWTPLHVASWEGHEIVVELLIKASANPDEKDKNGWTPLHLASDNGRKEIVELLIKAGANPKEKTNDGWTPLHAASRNGCKEIVYLLIKASANPNEKDNNGSTPLHAAATRNQIEAAKALVAAGAVKTIQDSEGKTPRDIALQWNYSMLAKFL